MEYHQAITNVAAKQASAAELNKWRDQQVDPVLLTKPPLRQPSETAERPLGFLVAAEAGRVVAQREFITWDNGLIGT